MNWNTRTKAIDELEQCISSLELAVLLIPALSAQEMNFNVKLKRNDSNTKLELRSEP